jgi:hypothetical protein
VALERRSTGAADGGSGGDLRCCGCGLSRARERELEWGKGGDGAALPFKRDPRRGGEMLPRWSVGAGGGCAQVRAKREGWRLGATLTCGPRLLVTARGRAATAWPGWAGPRGTREREKGRRPAGRFGRPGQRAELEGSEGE